MCTPSYSKNDIALAVIKPNRGNLREKEVVSMHELVAIVALLFYLLLIISSCSQ
jgi:hypothetical protein